MAGYKVAPKTAGIEIDGINHWMSIAANASSPRTSVILDIEKPSIHPMWGDVGAGVVRKGNYKLHIGDCGQLGRPGDWSRPNPDTNGARSPASWPSLAWAGSGPCEDERLFALQSPTTSRRSSASATRTSAT